MPEPFKNIYNSQFFADFTQDLLHIIPDLDKKAFLNDIYDKDWKSRELKQRMRHISGVLKKYLPDDYQNAVVLLLLFIEHLKNIQCTLMLEYMFIPDYIEQYGLDDYDTSINALCEVTKFTSCEFAVRPFIIKYPEQMMKQMLAWSKHENSDVRRFATEGCRPRLPWAMALPLLKNNPSNVLPILENLKNDASDYVRKSVANNLNDISKDNPDVVIKLIKKWQGKSENTDWVIKHGSRTLLKQGNTEVMQVFGFGSVKNIKIKNIKILTPEVKIGDALEFVFELHNNKQSTSKLRLEYGLYYQKANSSLSKKVYKISEKEYAANSISIINRKQSFRQITTRKFHTGLHQLSIIVNGNEFEKLDFELID